MKFQVECCAITDGQEFTLTVDAEHKQDAIREIAFICNANHATFDLSSVREVLNFEKGFQIQFPNELAQ